MDSNFMTQLLFSIAIFAPGVILLAGLGFVGLLMLLEKAGLFGAHDEAPVVTPVATPSPSANPEPGPVVAGLKQVRAQADTADRGTGTGPTKAR